MRRRRVFIGNNDGRHLRCRYESMGETMKRAIRVMLIQAALAAASCGTTLPASAADAEHSASALTAQATSQLDATLAAIVADPQQPMASLSVLAIRAGHIVYQQQFGARYIGADGTNLPAGPATMYRIASISKMMTTLGVMKLIEEHQLSLDEDIGNYLGYPVRNPHFPEQPVTLRTLLTHTSSLRDAAGYFWGADMTLRDLFTPGSKLYGDGRMWAANAGPGAYFTYCNLGWGVIGTVMEKVSGERFDHLMQRLLLAPMAIHGGYNPAEFSAADISNVATLYRKRTVDTERWDLAGPWIAQADDVHLHGPQEPAGLATYVAGSNATIFSPTGGLRISAADLGKIMLMLINDGQYEGRQIIQPASLALMFSTQWTYDKNKNNGDTANGMFQRWGLGNQQFSPASDGRDRLVADPAWSALGHLGDAYGLYSTFVVDLRHKNGWIALIGGTGTDPEQNHGHYSALSRYEERIDTALYRSAILGQAAN